MCYVHNQWYDISYATLYFNVSSANDSYEYNYNPIIRPKLICIPPSGVEKRPRKMELIGCPETSVRYYHCSLRNNPIQRSSQNLFIHE